MKIFAQRHNQPERQFVSSLARSSRATANVVHHTHPILQLQRAIGNQAVQRLLRELAPARRNVMSGETELTQVVQPGRAARLGSRIALKRPPTNQTAEPSLQRLATAGLGPVHENNNLAETVLRGKNVGDTFAVLNGSRVDNSGQARKALKKPALTFSAVAAAGFDAQVTTVPTNKLSTDETVLAARRWTLEVSKPTVRGKFPHLTACRGKGRTTFRAFGAPSEAAMFAASRRHEDRHANDHVATFLDTVAPWDKKLDAAASKATAHHGKTKAKAETALWAAMGGTPDQVANSYVEAAAAAIDAYHSTPKGGSVSWDPDTAMADETCASSSVECTNPS